MLGHDDLGSCSYRQSKNEVEALLFTYMDEEPAFWAQARIVCSVHAGDVVSCCQAE